MADASMPGMGGMSDQYFQELMNLLGEPGRQAMLDASTAEGRIDLAKQNLGTGQGLGKRAVDLGEAMAMTPGAKGMTVGPHNVYVAASPFEHAAVAMARIMGQRKMEEGRGQISEAQKKANKEQAKAMADIAAGKQALLSGMNYQGMPMLGPEMPPAYDVPMPPGYAFPSYGE